MNSQRKAGPRNYFRARAIWIIVPWLFGNCGMKEELAQLKISAENQRRQLGRMYSHLTYCPAEVQLLVDQVEARCAGKKPCWLADADIEHSVSRIAPWSSGDWRAFRALMQGRRHVTIYPTPDGAQTDAAKMGLRDLVQQPWFDGTRSPRFLVIAYTDSRHESPEQAAKRSEPVITAIRDLAKTRTQAQAKNTTTTEAANAPAYVLAWTVEISPQEKGPEDQARKNDEKVIFPVSVYRLDY